MPFAGENDSFNGEPQANALPGKAVACGLPLNNRMCNSQPREIYSG